MSYKSILKPDLFKDQVIIVTGGGSGIGRCTAHELTSLGAQVVIVGRKQDKLDAVAAEIAEDGGRVSTRQLDIRREDDVKSTIESILEESGRIDGLVNNAGGQFPSPLGLINQKGWETVLRTNLTGGFLVARECYNQYMNENAGTIVNMIADMWSGMPGMGHSGAARAGMLNFTETAAVEWGGAGVRVNAVAPGWIASSGLDTYDESFIKDLIPRMKAGVPLGRLAQEAEVSAAICFLLSPAAAFITGTCIKIDGGSSLNTKLFPIGEHNNCTPYTGFHRAYAPAAVGEK